MKMSTRPAATKADWWRQAVVYQIYPRSFADSDGDGLGDLRGILSRVPYLAALGIDAVWLSPFYPSALTDGGYDVDDYRDVDPRLGTLTDFDEMTAGLHGCGIKVIIDIVPNHTSNRHAWFREALASPKGSPARDRYIFRDGRGPDGAQPPSDWPSMFGGPAWTRVPDGQWYLHLFAAEQPDLNWANREVRDDFLATLRFWSDRGVDGFRVDVAHGLAKDLSEPLESLPAEPDPGGQPVPHGAHPLWDRDEVHDIYAEWRQVFNEYSPPRVGVAEAWVHPSRRSRYASPDGLGQAFNFDLLEANWDAAQFLRVITDNLADARQHGASTTWVLSNHDVVRHASRYALLAEDHLSSTRNARAWLLSNGTSPELDRGLGLRRARAATLLMLALPGSAYLYQGEELGLHEVPDIPAGLLQDPAFLRSGGTEKGRDGCRVPLPWASDGPSFGFSAGAAHLPQPAWFGPLSVEAQERDPASTLTLYRQALSWRRQLQAAEGSQLMPGTNGQVLHFGRPGGWQCVTNFGPRAVPLPHGTVVVASSPLQEGLLPADTTAWIIPPAPDRAAGRPTTRRLIQPGSDGRHTMLRLADAWIWDFWLADDDRTYHLYFLKAPRRLRHPDERHHNVSIGHATSPDLADWTVVSNAVTPSDGPAFDDIATWTGSVVRGPDGTWFMFYTGVGSREPAFKQRIGLATSADLQHWSRHRGSPVLESDSRWYMQFPDVLPSEAWRDPWVFADPGGDGWHMLLTARACHGPADQRGVIGHARSPDLIHWQAQPPLSQPGEGFSHLEVPQVEVVEGRPVLVFSCLTAELSGERRKAGTGGGTWCLPCKSLLGPFDLTRAVRMTDESLYSGRLIRDRAGRWVMLAFRNRGRDGRFIGELTDPVPVQWADDGSALKLDALATMTDAMPGRLDPAGGTP